ncbi:hypothetical protein [Bacillus sp. AK031]
MKNKGDKKYRFEQLLQMAVVIAALFLFFQWDDAKSKVKTYEQSQASQINYQLEELHTVLFSIEETLHTYEFPVQDDVRIYYQDALDNDIQRLHHLGHTIQQINEYSNFMILNKNYLSEIENVLKGLRGFQYTEDEKSVAIDALTDVRSKLYSLMERRDFSVEDEADREEVLLVLGDFIEKLAVLERY